MTSETTASYLVPQFDTNTGKGATNTSCLPVPDFDGNIRHTRKRTNQRDSQLSLRKPPKINKYDTMTNISGLSTSPHVISFREPNEANALILSNIYNKNSPESYFEQCFDVISKIGEGSFGEVYKVRSKEDGLLYAIKKSKQYYRSEKYREERLQEVKRYEQFSNHDHCVTLYNAWEEEYRLYMQMELCEGNLESYLEKHGYIPENKIWSILLDLLLALKELHDRNLIHLDIKLENILIASNGSCKLCDFGLVVDVDRANRSDATEGDSRYIAPELLQGNFSKAADIFSSGIAVLELSCNLDLPPNGPLWQQLRHGILPEEFIKVISPELKAVISVMMAPDPSVRPSVDQLLTHKRLQPILKHRKRWGLFKRIKIIYRESYRGFWKKVCNLKHTIHRFINYILVILKLKKSPTVQEEDQNNSSPEQFLNESNVDHSPLHNFSNIFGEIANSTPLNHCSENGRLESVRRQKLELLRVQYRSLHSTPAEDDSSMHISSSSFGVECDFSPAICKKLNFKTEDSE